MKYRLNFIIILRVAAMLMVVMYHSLCFNSGIWNGCIETIDIYNKFANLLNDIDMKVFVLISGYLYGYLFFVKQKYKNKISFLKNKFSRLLLPYFIWGGIMCLLFPSKYNIIDLFFGIGHLWFLLMLFDCFVIFTAVRYLWESKSRKKDILLLLILLVFMSTITYHSIPYTQILCIGYFMRYGLFFFSGILLSKYMKRGLIISNVLLVLLITSFFFLVVIRFSLGLPFIVNRFGPLFFSCVLSLSLFCYICNSDNKDKNKIQSSGLKILNYIDKYSMGIYIVHQIFLLGFIQVPTIRIFLTHHYLISPLIQFVSSITVSLVIVNCFEKLHVSKYVFG